MGVLIPYVTSWIIDRGIMTGDLGKVVAYGGVMLVIAIFSLTFGILAGRNAAEASSGFAYNLREAMYRNIQTFSFSNIDRFSTSSLITRMTTDVSNLQNAYQMLLRVSVRAPLMLVSSIVMCFFIHASVSWIFVIALAILAVVLWSIISRTVKLFAQVFERYDDLNNSVQENVQAIRVVKAFVREEYEKKRFGKAVDNLYRLFVKTESLMAINHPVMMLVVYGCIIALSWWGAHYVVGGTLTTGQLTSLFSYVMSILMSLMMLSMIFVTLTMSTASGKRIAEVLEERPDLTNVADAVTEMPSGSIDFDNVSFSYCGDIDGDGIVDYAISDINLHIDSGETIGVIGGTGSGKTTLASLISRLYDATVGTVAVGGIDVRRYDMDTLRSQVATVLQKNVLFTGSVLDNLRWGRTDATLEECREACRIAAADDFVSRMPQGYDTILEQGGANLSGGQRQRLCIARALLKRPKVLILDDSTSACDNATDARIRRAFAGGIPDTTTIIIAQRVQSVSSANRIIVMDGGRIVGFDTHRALLDSCPIYREIYDIQMQDAQDFDRPATD